ncbi:MAG: molecular chaperone DjiA [Pseudomonadota bacterium]
MSIWDRIEAFLEEARRRTLGALLEVLAEQKQRRDDIAFSIALIALSAKMAKADGVVTDDEIAAFKEFFDYPETEADKVRMIYQLAQQDVAGFDAYLRRVARMFADEPIVLEDVLDCLFYVAAADGVAHPGELELLNLAAKTFNIGPEAYGRLKAAHLGLGEDDPHVILGVEIGADLETIKTAYRQLARDHHPDALIARGVPAHLARIAERRLAAVNEAYERIVSERRRGQL